MKLKRQGFTAALCCGALLWFGFAAAAQNSSKSETFKGHMSPVPIDASMLPIIAGSGSLTATLSGNILTVAGTFEGLKSPATTAHIHRGPRGIPGPAILDLTVTKTVKGAVNGSFELTPEQLADVKDGLWYVQIESEKAPEGNLWGWLLR
jgi:hypothetical protein